MFLRVPSQLNRLLKNFLGQKVADPDIFIKAFTIRTFRSWILMLIGFAIDTWYAFTNLYCSSSEPVFPAAFQCDYLKLYLL